MHNKRDNELRRLAEQLGISDLFPYAREQRLRQLLDNGHPSLFAIKGFNAASAEPSSRHMPVLEQALTGRLQCWLMTKPELTIESVPVLIGNALLYKGFWHL